MSESSTTRHFLYPGTILVLKEPGQISTILGSCVAVCLWDPIRRIGGMNHFLLPFWNGEGLPTPRYGNIATGRLVEELVRSGAKLQCLKAKIFGGAKMTAAADGIYSVGERNAATAISDLERYGIRIDVSHVGGDKGRKIIFDTGDGAVYVSRSHD